jgi:hypothetical protein
MMQRDEFPNKIWSSKESYTKQNIEKELLQNEGRNKSITEPVTSEFDGEISARFEWCLILIHISVFTLNNVVLVYRNMSDTQSVLLQTKRQPGLILI